MTDLWIIQVYRPQLKRWKSVKMSMDGVWRRHTGIADSKRDLTPRTLEDCIRVLKDWYEEIALSNFQTKEGDKPSDWTYRIKRLNSKESIPGELFK